MNSICGRIFPMEISEERLALSWLILRVGDEYPGPLYPLLFCTRTKFSTLKTKQNQFNVLLINILLSSILFNKFWHVPIERLECVVFSGFSF